MASEVVENQTKRSQSKDSFRMTLPRKLILQCLREAENYLTADDIFVALYPEYPGIGLATIYRTLNLLEEYEMINKVNLGDGKARFALTEEEEAARNYHQLICKRCFKVIKIDEFSESEIDCFSSVEQQYAEQFNFTIESHIVQYYGVCEECAAKALQEDEE